MKAYHTRPLLEKMALIDNPAGRHALQYVGSPIATVKLATFQRVKFCKDCVWHSGSQDWDGLHKCGSPDLLDMVTGEFTDCSKNRHNSSLCGRSGRYFAERSLSVISFCRNRPLVLTNDTRSEPDDYTLPIVGSDIRP